jgi:AcrR family transcriptional regulator
MSKARTEECIVDAAVQLFAEQGFNGTRTKNIARLAGVNETTMFRYFPSKQVLFWAGLQSRLKQLRLSKELQTSMARNEAPEIVLPLIVEFIVETATYQPELLRLLAFGLLELRPDAERFCRQHLSPIVQAISDYLSGCVKRGELRSLDPLMSCLALASTAISHQSLYQILMGYSPPYTSTKEATAAHTRFWLDALVFKKPTTTDAGPLGHSAVRENLREV